MNEETIRKAEEAYYAYISNQEDDIEKEIKNYVLERIEANKDTIQKVTEITKEKIDIKGLSKWAERDSEYKKEKTFSTDKNGFIKGIMTLPKGIILKVESEPEKVVGTYIEAILSRNAIIVSDIEYLEISVKKLILEIVKEALKKFGLNEDLIQLKAYEEINDEEFDIYMESKEKYVYLEDEELRKEAEKEEVELLTGELDEVIKKINSKGICEGAVIYTADREKAYKFINRVVGKNVFVNASLQNIGEAEVTDLYIRKNVIYPTMI